MICVEAQNKMNFKKCLVCSKKIGWFRRLWIHHLNRKIIGGLDVVCRECSEKYHYKEFK